ncbi:MAG: DNA-3-methyladenine glycosylase I [Actinomycetota bacterium]
MDPGRDGVAPGADGKLRCWWCVGDPLYEAYHDREWGRPVGDDRTIFEKLILEGFMSGLSWLTILRKRENFRKVFKDFEPAAVARFSSRDVERLLGDAGIVRHRGKIESTINNAKRYRELIKEVGSLASHVWSFEPDPSSRPAALDWTTLTELPLNPKAKALSKDLKKRGWSFVGPTTVYSAMESLGLVNDHVEKCYARKEVKKDRSRFIRP